MYVKIKENKEKLLFEIKETHLTSLYKDITLPKLIAVSKKQPVEKIVEALKCGQKIFGENRVQEADKKWRPILKEYKDLEPIVDSYKQYSNLLANISEAKEILSDSNDPEMKDMAKAELETNLKKKEQ